MCGIDISGVSHRSFIFQFKGYNDLQYMFIKCLLFPLFVFVFSSPFQKLLCVSMLALLCAYVARCALRSHQWRSEQSLFTSALSVCPLNAKVNTRASCYFLFTARISEMLVCMWK